jgi:uncharacterized protein YdbL (DUF1318 family)
MVFSQFRASTFVSALAAWLFLVAGGTALLPASVVPAAAQSDAAKMLVDSAKMRGLVGEQGDGFLGFVVPPADPALAAAVAEINAGRAQVYREIAARTAVTPEAAGQATAQQLFERLPAGQYFKTLTGMWVRK